MTETQGIGGTGPGGGTVLDRIVAAKWREIAGLERERASLAAAAAEAPPPRDFEGALRHPGAVALIAEVKRRSPGAGPIRPDLEPAELARGYAEAGASALSVLTDRDHFGGTLEDLRVARKASGLPVLRKDFVVDPVQVLEARAAGADAVLLIVRILDRERLETLLQAARELGMAALVEAHDRSEVRRALDAGARVVGVNNRDLSRFETRLEVTLELASEVPEEILLVSESGIKAREDVARVGGAGADAVLVGEGLLTRPDPGAAARSLVGVPRGERALGARHEV